MPLPRVHPWCCEDVAESVTVDLNGERVTLPFCITMTVIPSASSPPGYCCRCVAKRVKLAYRDGLVGTRIDGWDAGGRMPDGSPMPMAVEPVAVWQGDLRGPCGLETASLVIGRIIAPAPYRHDGHGIVMYDGSVLVWHSGSVPSRSGLWFTAHTIPVSSYPEGTPVMSSDPRLRQNCGPRTRFVVMLDLAGSDPCSQSPERCAEPPPPNELCRAGVPPGLIVRLWGPPVDDHSGCRLNGHGFVLTRPPDDIHGHGDIICDDERQLAVYEGTILDCTLGQVLLPIRVTLYRRYNAEVRQRLEVTLQLGGGTYIKRVRECEELPRLTFRVDERLFDVLPVSEARIEPYYGPPTSAAAGLWCSPRWEPPCPRPARLLAEIGVLTDNADECVALRGWWTGERYMTFLVRLPCVHSGELDEMSGCCEWRGNIVISPIQVTGTSGTERFLEWSGDITLRARYLGHYRTGVVRAMGSAYLGSVYGHDIWMDIMYEDWFLQEPEPPWFHRGRGPWVLYVAGVGGYWSTGWSRLQVLP